MTSFGLGAIRHGIRVKWTLRGAEWYPSQIRSEFWDKISDFVWNSLRVWLGIGSGTGMGRFYPDPSSNSGCRPKRVDLVLG